MEETNVFLKAGKIRGQVSSPLQLKILWYLFRGIPVMGTAKSTINSCSNTLDLLKTVSLFNIIKK